MSPEIHTRDQQKNSPALFARHSRHSTTTSCLALPLYAGGLMSKLLDRVRSLARMRHYSRRTEQSYVFRLKRKSSSPQRSLVVRTYIHLSTRTDTAGISAPALPLGSLDACWQAPRRARKAACSRKRIRSPVLAVGKNGNVYTARLAH